MEIGDLNAFVSVIEQGGITRASRELNRVPSGITTRIMQLEDELGVKLFLREKKKLLATPEGEKLYKYAKKILSLVDEAKWQLKNRKPGGVFRLGTMESTLASRLPPSLALLHSRYPEICIELTTGTSQSLYKMLSDNQINAIFVADPPDDERMEKLPVYEEKLVLIAHRDHPPIMNPEDIQQATLLAFNEGCAYRERLLQWFNFHTARHGQIVSLASCNAIICCAAAGMGVGITPLSVLQNSPQKNLLSIHPLRHPFGVASTILIWRKSMESANLLCLQECLGL